MYHHWLRVVYCEAVRGDAAAADAIEVSCLPAGPRGGAHGRSDGAPSRCMSGPPSRGRLMRSA